MKSFYYQTKDKHTLHFVDNELPSEEAILLLHGGPGVGCRDYDYALFQDLGLRCILPDQRGSGRSVPLGSIVDNTTQHLIGDIVDLLDHLNILKVHILGGSWGSTLAVLFAQLYPDRVKSLILRGLFVADRESCAYYEDKTTDAHKTLMMSLGISEDVNPFQYAYRQLCDPDRDSTHIVSAIYRYNQALIGPSAPVDDKFSVDEVTREITKIKLHYLFHNFFIPESEIWYKMTHIQSIPIQIVHGIHDELCDPKFVRKFAEAHGNSQVHWVDAGHHPAEVAIIDQLRHILRGLAIS